MHAYVSISFQHRLSDAATITCIKKILLQFAIEPIVFVERYQFTAAEEKQMMSAAMADIDRSAFLIAEASHKAIGVGIEAGYARALNKPVIYLRHRNATHSTTLSGMSDYHIVYEDLSELEASLTTIITQLLREKLLS